MICEKMQHLKELYVYSEDMFVMTDNVFFASFGVKGFIIQRRLMDFARKDAISLLLLLLL